RLHVDQRRQDALQLLPEQLLAHVHRHQDARRQDRALHQRLLVQKGTVENLDALKVLNKERQKRMKQYPNLVDYEAKLAFKSFIDVLGASAVMPDHGTPV